MDPSIHCSSSGGSQKTVGRWHLPAGQAGYADGRLERGDPPWLAFRHREVDVGSEGCGPPSQSERHPERSPAVCLAGSEGSAIMGQILRPGEAGLRMTKRCDGDPPWLAVRHREVDVGQNCPLLMEATGCSVPIPVSRDGPFSTLVSTAVQGENARGREHREGVGQGAYCRPTRNWRKGVLYPYDSVPSSSAAGGRLANGSDCFDIGNYQLATCGERRRTISHWQFMGLGPPTQTNRHPERSPEFCEGRSEGSARFGQRLPARREGASEARGHPWESGLGMTQRPRGAPPWSAVRHREVDVGCSGGEAPRSERRMQIADLRLMMGDPPWLAVQHREVDVGLPPNQCRRHPEPDLSGEGSAITDQILRVCETTLRMTKRRGCGPPVYEGRSQNAEGRSRSQKFTLSESRRCLSGRVEGVEGRSRSHNFTLSESRSCLSGRVEGVEGRWTCKCFNITAPRSRTSDAEHEFTRARSPGSTPMRSFRCSRGLQLLLMRPSSARGRVESDPRSDQTTHVTWGALS